MRKEVAKEITEVFQYEGSNVRIVIKDGKPWFVAKDVCDVLEIKNTTDAIKRLDEDEVTRFNLGGRVGETNIVNEPGLYSLILGSRKPEAKQFKRWITHEVLPQIRKTGQYNPYTDKLPKTFSEALRQLAEAVEENEKMRPKAEMYDVLMDGENTQDMQQVAKSFGIGRNKLFAFLREKGVLMEGGYKHNLPYQRYLDNDFFEVQEISIGMGDTRVNKTKTLVTPKGIDLIGKLLRGEGIIDGQELVLK